MLSFRDNNLFNYRKTLSNQGCWNWHKNISGEFLRACVAYFFTCPDFFTNSFEIRKQAIQIQIIFLLAEINLG